MTSHSVRFYEDNRFPSEAIAAYLAAALHEGGAVLAVAMPPHRAAIRDELEAAGIDIEARSARGQVVLFDAEEILSRLYVGDELDDQAFSAQVGRRVHELLSRYSFLRVFGEMVDVLCRRGDGKAALRLEAMWNRLRREHPFDLLCTYGFGHFEDPARGTEFSEICREHGHVSMADLDGADADAGAVHLHADRISAHFEQQRRALQRETSARRRLEAERGRRFAAERFLAETRHLLSSSLDYQLTLDRITQLVVPDFADFCFIDLLDETGNWFERVTNGHDSRGSSETARAPKRRYPLRADAPYGIGRALADLRAQMGCDLPLAPGEAAEGDLADTDPARSPRAKSFVTAPLVARGRAIGTLTLLARDRNFDDCDRWIAEELASGAAIAIDNAKLFAAEARARVRIDRMQQVTAALSRSSTAEHVAETACRIGSEAMAAHSGALWLKQADGSLRLAGTWGTPRSFIEQFLRIGADEVDSPALAVVRSGSPLWVETEEDYRRVSPTIFEKAKSAGRLSAYGAVPLLFDAEVAGVLVFAHDLDHVYDSDERAFYLTLAGHCSQALERARLLDAERRSNERLRLLARAGEVLWGSLEIEVILRELARTLVPAFADCSIVFMLEGHDLRATALAHCDPGRVRPALEAVGAKPARISDRGGPGAVLASGHARFVPRLREAVRASPNDEHLAAMQRLGFKSAIDLPVFAGGDPVAVLSFLTGDSGAFYEQADCEFAAEIARRAGAAIERARLYRSFEQAARRAEEANRVKDEFLATVSHELRTPLSAISGWSAVLARKKNDANAVAKAVEVISRNVKAQTKLIEDILDVSRIITGKLKIDSQPVDLVTIVSEALDVVRPSADAKQLAISVALPDGPCLVVGDGHRLQQVTWNLLSNAIKFTPAGGRISVRVEHHGSTAGVVVSDTGCGIAPELLQRVFDRFMQADSSTTRRFGGLGLGLAIVRHIVELHGGRAWAESPGEGQGATFRFAIPVRGATASPF